MSVIEVDRRAVGSKMGAKAAGLHRHLSSGKSSLQGNATACRPDSKKLKEVRNRYKDERTTEDRNEA